MCVVLSVDRAGFFFSSFFVFLKGLGSFFVTRMTGLGVVGGLLLPFWPGRLPADPPKESLFSVGRASGPDAAVYFNPPPTVEKKKERKKKCVARMKNPVDGPRPMERISSTRTRPGGGYK